MFSLVGGFKPFIAKSGVSGSVNIFRVKQELSESLHNPSCLYNVFLRCLLFTGLIFLLLEFYAQFGWHIMHTQGSHAVNIVLTGLTCALASRFHSSEEGLDAEIDEREKGVYCADVRGSREHGIS